jgi:hypothetical protein
MRAATHDGAGGDGGSGGGGGGGSWSGGGGSAWGAADVAAGAVTWRDLSWEELVDEASRLGRDERFSSLTDDALADQVAEGAAQLDAALCRWLELVGELVVRGIWADQGARTPGQWLSWKLGIGRSTGLERVRVALALREFPATRERFAAGTLSYSKVRAITRCGVPAEESCSCAGPTTPRRPRWNASPAASAPRSGPSATRSSRRRGAFAARCVAARRDRVAGA